MGEGSLFFCCFHCQLLVPGTPMILFNFPFNLYNNFAIESSLSSAMTTNVETNSPQIPYIRTRPGGFCALSARYPL